MKNLNQHMNQWVNKNENLCNFDYENEHHLVAWRNYVIIF